MKSLQMKVAASGVHIEGHPNAAKVIALDGKQAERLAHLALHRRDLQFALNCLERINTTDDDVLREAAWWAAVTAFVKCFIGGSRRSQLGEDKVYAGNALAKDAFSYIKNLRDKHLVHDVNAFQQAHTGAIINKPGANPKVEDVITLTITGVSLEQSAWNNLHQLATDALAYVAREYDESVEGLKTALEGEEYARLIGRPDISYTFPPGERSWGQAHRPIRRRVSSRGTLCHRDWINTSAKPRAKQ